MNEGSLNMNETDKNRADDKILLSDQEFVALMDAEHKKQPHVVTDLEKQAIWNKVDQRIGQRSGVKMRPIAGWLAALAAALVAIPIAMLSLLPSEHTRRNKGETFTPAVVLNTYLLLPNGETRIIGNGVQPGDTLVLKTGVTEPAVVGLAVSVNRQPFSLRFTSEELAAGMEHLLINGQSTYGYVVEKTDTVLTFCALNLTDGAVSADDASTVQEAVKRLPASACATLFVNGEAAKQ